jgi:hypothetical protein
MSYYLEGRRTNFYLTSRLAEKESVEKEQKKREAEGLG